ncbi:MAG: hypothetical protein D6780_07250 [Candidatus Dadabacteria bacterium]|nr:MAG: hypothetical protein D6780_07250 [Candidatus Dadabacteria bacterium]
MTIKVNGEVVDVKTEGLGRFSDLIELIKTMIDPEHMITSITIDGADVKEEDWQRSLSTFSETSVLEIETARPSEFVTSRMTLVPEIIKNCCEDFKEARENFEAGRSRKGNEMLIQAVQTLQVFIEWYSAILELVPIDQRDEYDISEPINQLTETCKKLCQHQLYQSWWALSQTLGQDLEPKLSELEALTRSFSKAEQRE